MGKMVLAALFSLVSGVAFCQSNPGFYYGQVPTAAQWNSAFSQKQDVLNFTPLNTAGGTMTGELITAPSSTLLSGLNIPAGVAPTSPVNGDVWTTLAGLYVQINGSTVGPIGTASSVAWAAITGIDASANVEGTGLWGVDAATGTSTMFLFQAPATIPDADQPRAARPARRQLHQQLCYLGRERRRHDRDVFLYRPSDHSRRHDLRDRRAALGL